MSNTKNKNGLRQQIASAKTHQDIDMLLNVGREFGKPSFKTMRGWQVAAAKRRKELGEAPVVQENAASVAYVSNGRAERRRARRAS